MDREGSGHTPSGLSQPSSGSTPQGTTAGTQSSQSQNHPTPAASSSSSTKKQSSSTQNTKRRRGLGVVTPNACTECRKKRAKCDGQKPCGRCKAQKDIDCVYELPVRQSKENLRTEIESLRIRQRSSDHVFAALVRPNLWEEVLRRLRGGQAVESISDWLGSAVSSDVSGSDPIAGSSSSGFGADPSRRIGRLSLGVDTGAAQQSGMRGDMRQNSPWTISQTGSTRSNSYSDAMNWTSDNAPAPQHAARVGSWAEGMPPDHGPDAGLPRYRGLEHVLSYVDDAEVKVSPQSWTSITGDINLVQHLLALYFCWEYPTFASLSKEHFLQDFQDGRHRYCSPMLVNALLALGCRFSTHPMTRANPNDPYTSGDHFFKESQRLFIQETDHHTLTTIQALGIMSIREASCGRDSESWYYAGQSIRLAVEMGLHRIQDGLDEDELAVQAATFWGAFALDHAWSLATGSLPQCSSFPHLPPKPGIIGNIEASLWVPYTDDGAPLQRSCEQPSNVRSVYKCFCELSELIYTQYLNWYDKIPEVLRLGHNFTPAVLFAHMYYHFAILLLFRPLIKLRIIGSKILPKDVCSQAADAIQGLLTSYSQLYTLRRTPSFVPYFVLTASIMHLAIGASVAVDVNPGKVTPADIKKAIKIDPRVSEALKRGIADLTEMAPCHHFAEQALKILRYLAKKWNIEVDFDNSNITPDDYDRLVRPYASSLNFFAPNVGVDDFICDWGSGNRLVGIEESRQVEKTAESMQNPLFWPFPMQGRPILPTGKELEQAGFALLNLGRD
ncbi:hypothetical protein ED733_002248 [Metarhizium rileyi]|uniref:Zn(2)-C6 fungal-type domain-containing protein n=1 Tax=Metarhizium rileyi (strain RCEF 4871) TaxID=1649241 RepID=A0A5C6G0G3_METRR|nr:hypothetical protein ED733_002248 [Metarhizium rileyi]